MGYTRQSALGKQIYVVYPLIKESEKLDYQNLQQGYDDLVQEFKPPNYQISILHGPSLFYATFSPTTVRALDE